MRVYPGNTCYCGIRELKTDFKYGVRTDYQVDKQAFTYEVLQSYRSAKDDPGLPENDEQ